MEDGTDDDEVRRTTGWGQQDLGSTGEDEIGVKHLLSGGAKHRAASSEARHYGSAGAYSISHASGGCASAVPVLAVSSWPGLSNNNSGLSLCVSVSLSESVSQNPRRPSRNTVIRHPPSVIREHSVNSSGRFAKQKRYGYGAQLSTHTPPAPRLRDRPAGPFEAWSLAARRMESQEPKDFRPRWRTTWRNEGTRRSRPMKAHAQSVCGLGTCVKSCDPCAAGCDYGGEEAPSRRTAGLR
ncbi:hypothetical protein BGZ61DRAFT_547294 [Ilyonectria robusta]|uniref:uncharacterized protein n=1 Tax=Ilyonectria robusta TaxID=1079257 RepID=UPI001E8E1FAD|nr:uncharacterized protein BGZ61DRAFT_547294 [Ilyonectria robusta]KAH8686765.1 hypothetical protein BGZ61DRAFT_547294 [Ilyonectria robusta]